MRVAIIGCGNIAQVHAWALGEIKTNSIVAFADCRSDRAEKMAQKFTGGQANIYVDYLEMLEQEKPDVVHICTPHYLHVPMAMEALKRGVSVFMEKPPAITQAEFDKLIVVEKESAARLGFCFQNRYKTAIHKLDSIVGTKEFGEVISARSFVTWKRDEGYYSDDWHGNLQKEGGGVLINQSIHTLDLMLRYLGEPLTVEASMQNHHLKGVIEVEDTLEAWMEFSDKKRGCFYATTAYGTDAPVILEVSFERGRVTMIGDMLQLSSEDGGERVVHCRENGSGVGKSYWGNGHLACITDFYRSLETGSSYRNDIEGVKNTFTTMMRIYESARK